MAEPVKEAKPLPFDYVKAASSFGVPLAPLKETTEIADKEAIQRGERPSFNPKGVGFDTFTPTAEHTTGTKENMDLIQKVINTKAGQELIDVVSLAYLHRDDVVKKQGEWDTEFQTNMQYEQQMTPERGSAGMATAIRALTSGHKRPQIDPYADFILKFGYDYPSVVTGLTKSQDRAIHYFQKYQQKGLGDLIKANPGLISGKPEALVQAMEGANMFDSKEEREFFESTRQDAYSEFWGISPYSLIHAKYKHDAGDLNHPSNLIERMWNDNINLTGQSKAHRTMFREYEAWKTKNPGPGFFDNFGNVASMITESLVNTVHGAITSTGQPEFGWQPEWEAGTITPANLEKKQRFEQLLFKLAGASSDELGNFTSSSEMQLARKMMKESGAAGMKIPSPTDKKTIPKIIQEIVVEFNKLKNEGAFREDSHFSGALTVLSAATTMTAGLPLLVMSTDPTSVVARAERTIGGIIWTPMGYASSNLETIHFDPTGVKDGFAAVSESIAMNNLNNAVKAHKMWEHFSATGILPDEYIDSRWHQDASMVTDLTMLRTPFMATARTFGRYSGVRGAMIRRELQMGSEIAVAKLERLAQRGMKAAVDFLPADLRVIVNEVKEAGIVRDGNGNVVSQIDDYEALRRIYKKEGKMPDPKDPTKRVPITDEVLLKFNKSIGAEVDTLNRVRNHIRRIAAEGRQIVPSQVDKDIISKARKIWEINNPGILIDKITDSEMYQLIREGKIVAGKNAEGQMITLSKNEVAGITQRQGDYWRAINITDVAAFKRGAALPVEPGFFMHNPAMNSLRNLGHWGREVAQAARAAGAEHLPEGAPVRTTVRALHYSPTARQMDLISNGNFATYIFINALPQFGYALGLAGDWVKFGQDFMAQRGSKYNVMGSELLQMQRNYLAQKRDVLIQLGALGEDWATTQKEIERLGKRMPERPDLVSRARRTDEAIKELTGQVETYEKYAKWAKNLAAVGDYGLLSETARYMANGMVSATVNEALLVAGNPDAFGSGSAFALYGESTNFLHRTVTRNFTSGVSREERTSRDIADVTAKMSMMPESQQIKLLKKLGEVGDKAVEIAKQKGNKMADIWYAREIAAIASAYRVTGDVMLVDHGVMEGLDAMLRSQEMMTPEANRELRSHFLKKAEELGLKGSEADNYAVAMINNLSQVHAARTRVGAIAEERSNLDVSRNRLLTEIGTELQQVEKAAKIFVTESGLKWQDIAWSESITGNPGTLVPDPREFLGKGPEGKRLYLEAVDKFLQQSAAWKAKLDQIIVDGKPLSQHPEKTQKAVQKVQQEVERILALRRKKLQELEMIDAEEQSLVDETDQLRKIAPMKEFRQGEFYLSRIRGESMYTYKKGMTVWETDGRTVIFLDEKVFTSADAWEEVAHAGFFARNMTGLRRDLYKHILGDWKVNADGKREMVSPPEMAPTPEMSLDMLETFATAYAKEKLSDADGAEFLARWQEGRKVLAKDPNNWDGILPVVMELTAKAYVQRRLLSNPHQSRTPYSPSSSSGSYEATNIMGDSKQSAQGFRLFSKFAFGDLNIPDFFNGENINLLSLDFDPTNEAALTKLQKVKAAIQFIQYWGVGGTLDRIVDKNNMMSLQNMGFRLQRDSSGREWIDTSHIFDENTGRHIPTPEALDKWAESVNAVTRNNYDSIAVDELFNLDIIRNEQYSNEAGAQERRIKFLLASNKEHWLDPKTGKFKKPIEELYADTWKPFEALLTEIVLPQYDENSGWQGFKLAKDAGKGLKLFGAPNAEQAKIVVQYLKDYHRKYGDDNSHTMHNIQVIMEAIAQGSIFNPNAPDESAGWTQAFRGIYAGVTKHKGVGTEGKITVNGSKPEMREIVPVAVMIMESNLDVKGAAKAPDMFGEMPKKTEMYAWGVDLRKFASRLRNSWYGEVYASGAGGKKKGQQLWTNAEIAGVFGTSENMAHAVDLVLANYQNGGSLIKGEKTYKLPPEHSWEALLDMAGGNPALAKTMALYVNRIIGPHPTQYMELQALEIRAIKEKGKMSAANKQRLQILREKMSNPDEQGVSPADLIGRREAIIAEMYAKNEFDYFDDTMRDAQDIWTMFRVDRFQGKLSPIETKNGSLKSRFNLFTNGLAQVGYSGSRWIKVEGKELTDTQAKYNLEGRNITGGYMHPTGYNVWQMSNKDPQGKFIKQEWWLFDPKRNKLGSFPDQQAAWDAANGHSQKNLRPPIAGNRVELALNKAGWLASTMDMVGPVATSYQHKDGIWRIQRQVDNRGRPGYDLIHIPSGLTVDDGIKIGVDANGKPAIGAVAVAIKNAESTNQVKILLKKKWMQEIKKGKYDDWKIVGGDKKFFAEDNPYYYSFRKDLADLAGHEYADAITTLMRQQLGDSVIEDATRGSYQVPRSGGGLGHSKVDTFEMLGHAKTMEWIQKFMTTNDFSVLQANSQAIEPKGVLESRQAAQNALLTGLKAKWEKPKTPTQPSIGATSAEWTTFRQDLARFNEENAAWMAHEATTTPAPITPEAVKNLHDKVLGYIELHKQEVKRIKSKVIPISNTQMGLNVADALNDRLGNARTEVRAGAELAKTQLLLNSSGYFIESLMYQARPEFSGIEITGNKALVIGGPNAGKWWWNTGKSRAAQFRIYNPQGTLIATSNSLEDAQEEVYKHMTLGARAIRRAATGKDGTEDE